MPVQNPFPFPKILAKRETEKPSKEVIENKSNPIMNKVAQKNEDMDEGRTVIEYYGNIVKEFGSQKKAAPPLYLNTEDLKTVAETQHIQKSEPPKPKPIDNITSEGAIANTKHHKETKSQTKIRNSVLNQIKPKSQLLEKPKAGQKVKRPPSPKPPEKIPEKLHDKRSPKVLLKKTERATIVIPINYQELEQQAKVTVRSAIDYTVDFCLLLLAFWAYFFKDERLAIPFLVLIIYRQLQETVMMNIPQWVKLYAPNWLKTKKS
ncbi:hypothetical protein EVAR_70658_1 [Eumeta japonica]|uniref:Uncharacterized protein n=1 Tax=Eumeta variegata TaxID=151549 RepID=A0A4C1SLP8_EUMVA|nr:hypothetical protein EVAR_70658_1 [Eumeta japonica]